MIFVLSLRVDLLLLPVSLISSALVTPKDLLELYCCESLSNGQKKASFFSLTFFPSVANPALKLKRIGTDPSSAINSFVSYRDTKISVLSCVTPAVNNLGQTLFGVDLC